MPPLIMMHTGGCPARATGHTDAAKRVSDATHLQWVAGGWENTVGKWMAFKLEDGRTDNVLYDTKRDAVRHQFDEFLAFYIKLHPGGMSVCEAEVMLKVHRQIYLNGYRLTDPDAKNGGRDFIPRLSMLDVRQQVRDLIRGK
jgi:hypothetical protein